MEDIYSFLFSQYYNYSTIFIILEIVAIIFSILSVYFSLKNNILVFPTGIISTLLYIYLLYKWNLLGDMIVNMYYLYMSIFGWYIWTKKTDNNKVTPITYATRKEKLITVYIFIISILFIVTIYHLFNRWNGLLSYIDAITTGIFFAGMWLMAKRKIENWLYLLVADIISIPLYFIKGYTLSSMLYIVFSIFAVFGYLEWKKDLNKQNQIV